MDIVELEDAIPRLYQDQIELEASSNDLPWFYREEATGSESMFETHYGGFCHVAYHFKEPVASPIGASLIPVLFTFCEKAKVPLRSILRIRLGLFTNNMMDAVHHNPHVDFYGPHYTAVYYANDSDGDTFIFRETLDFGKNDAFEIGQQQAAAYAREKKQFTVAKRCSPRKGKMICFDGAHFHASMHPLKHSKRIAITFNFQ